MLHPSAWAAAVRGWTRALSDDGSGYLGQPADFLIAPDGRVLALHYGRHANDQWSVDDLLHLAGTHASAPPTRDG